MNKYTIYCTPEQTKKALELGAPLYPTSFDDCGIHQLWDEEKRCYYDIPTAEEMIGWLRENNLFINIIHISAGYTSWIKTIKENITLSEENTGFVKTYKETILTGIDIALEYLSSKS